MTQESKQQWPIRVLEEPDGETWFCPRCSYPLDMTAEGRTMELWECARCGYLKVLKGERK